MKSVLKFFYLTSLLFVLITSSMISSCGDEEDDNVTEQEQDSGKVPTTVAEAEQMLNGQWRVPSAILDILVKSRPVDDCIIEIRDGKLYSVFMHYRKDIEYMGYNANWAGKYVGEQLYMHPVLIYFGDPTSGKIPTIWGTLSFRNLTSMSVEVNFYYEKDGKDYFENLGWQKMKKVTPPVETIWSTNEEEEEEDPLAITLPIPPTKDLARDFSFVKGVEMDKLTIEDLQKSPMVKKGVTISIDEDGIIGGPNKPKNFIITDIKVTEDRKVLIQYIECPDELIPSQAPTRGGGIDINSLKKMYKFHDFTKSGDEYTITGFGKMVVHTSGNQTASIDLFPEGISIADILNVAVDIIFPSFNDEISGYLCRTWTISAYRILLTKNGSQIGNALQSSDGKCDLQALIDYANSNHDAKIGPVKGNKRIVNGITFTSYKTFLINYQNTEDKDVGYWAWSATDTNQKTGTIGYAWYDKEEMGNDILAGTATVAFRGNECDLRLQAKVDLKYKVEVQFKLK